MKAEHLVVEEMKSQCRFVTDKNIFIVDQQTNNAQTHEYKEGAAAVERFFVGLIHGEKSNVVFLAVLEKCECWLVRTPTKAWFTSLYVVQYNHR
jgi:hypothetical protein